ncbi:MAG: hypothetical protein JNJ60_05030, partial [Rhodocyclaceae bacterium]|nr:hypothetical protein [Rhodocyclaceae bacterium]
VLDAAVKRAPEAVDGRALYLQSLALSGQRARARTESEIWLKQKPDLPQALFVHVALSLSDGRRDQALLSYRKLQALDPALARQLHERSHRPGTPQSMQLPD